MKDTEERRDDRVEQAASRGRPEALTFEPDAVLDRIERRGDLHAPVLEVVQELDPEAA